MNDLYVCLLNQELRKSEIKYERPIFVKLGLNSTKLFCLKMLIHFVFGIKPSRFIVITSSDPKKKSHCVFLHFQYFKSGKLRATYDL